MYFCMFFSVSVDRTLREDDLDNDGYLTYAEYTHPRRKAKVTTPMERMQHANEAAKIIREQQHLV